jgi:hypothetical protein
MPIYSYSISADFPNSLVSISNLQNEIRSSSILTALDYISTDGDAIHIVFKDTLSPTDKTTLDGDKTSPAGGLIANHNHIEIPIIQSVVIADETIPTNGKWRFYTPVVTAHTGPNVVTVIDTTFDNPISLLNLIVRTTDANVGDLVDVYLLVPDSGYGEGVIGALSSEAATGSLSITVPMSIINNVYIADYITLQYGGTTQDMMNITAIDRANQKLYFKNPTTSTFPANMTLVKLKRYAMKSFTLGPPDLYEFGKDKIGSIYIRTGYIARVEYTNMSSQAKNLYCVLSCLE